jgi:hypothetical protein
MRCSIISSSGQVLASGQLFLQEDEEGDLRFSFRSDRGRVVEGGKIDANGDLTSASQELFRQFSRDWGVTGITLTAQART